MNDKQQILTALQEEFSRWEELLASLSEEQVTAPQLPAGLSIKDVMAHLMAWQQVSIARLEAAQVDKEPVYPNWLEGLSPESEEDVDQFNARIQESYRRQPWVHVYQDWRSGFFSFLKLAKEIPENDLLDAQRYPWLDGYPLIAVLQGSHEHHHEDHLEPLLAWLREHGLSPLR